MNLDYLNRFKLSNILAIVFTSIFVAVELGLGIPAIIQLNNSLEATNTVPDIFIIYSSITICLGICVIFSGIMQCIYAIVGSQTPGMAVFTGVLNIFVYISFIGILGLFLSIYLLYQTNVSIKEFQNNKDLSINIKPNNLQNSKNQDEQNKK